MHRIELRFLENAMDKNARTNRISPYDLNAIGERRVQVEPSRPTSKPALRPYEIKTSQKIAAAPKSEPPRR